MSKFIVKLTVFALILVAAAPALAGAPPQQEEQTIADLVAEDSRLIILAEALAEADLESTLQEEGPFTLFAPSDGAFFSMAEENLDELAEGGPDSLRNVLLYHLVPGQNLAADVAALESAETVLGEAVDISVEEDLISINQARVLEADIQAANGVIHIIDAVLLPPSLGLDETPVDEGPEDGTEDGTEDRTEDETMEEGSEDETMEETEPPGEAGPEPDDAAAPPGQEPAGNDIVETAGADSRFTTLVEAVQAAGLTDTLKGPGPFTVFAPTDDAFAALPDGALEDLLADEAALQNTLLYHVVRGRLPAADIARLGAADTVLGEPVAISSEAGSLVINEAQVIAADIETSNGVIHVIDAVLTPPASQPERQPADKGAVKRDRHAPGRFDRPDFTPRRGHHYSRNYSGRGFDRPGNFYYGPYFRHGYNFRQGYRGGAYNHYRYSYYGYYPYRRH